MATTQPAHDQESLGDIGRQIADDAARLVRMEVELAKAGMVESLKRGAIAIALVAVAMPILLIGMALAFAALPKHFGDEWWSWALAGAGFLLVALILAALAGLRVRAMVRTQRQTIAAIKEDVAWVKQLTRRDKSAT
jgi:hypothetical protein